MIPLSECHSKRSNALRKHREKHTQCAPWARHTRVAIFSLLFVSLSAIAFAQSGDQPIPQAGWRVLYVDSQETACGNYAATSAFDSNAATVWITQFCYGASPPPPHQIQIDLGSYYSVSGFQYLPRQDQASSGDIANYEFYVSVDGVNWGTAVATGTLIANSADHSLKQVTFPGVIGRYVRLRALSEVNRQPWTNVAEFNVLGVASMTSGPQVATVTLNPASISGGTTSTATVTLTSAPLTNATVTLTSSTPSAATVPATVTVNAGTTTATFIVTSASSVSATTASGSSSPR